MTRLLVVVAIAAAAIAYHTARKPAAVRPTRYRGYLRE